MHSLAFSLTTRPAAPNPAPSAGAALGRRRSFDVGAGPDKEARPTAEHLVALCPAEAQLVGAFLALLRHDEPTAEHHAATLRASHAPEAQLIPLLWIEAAGAVLLSRIDQPHWAGHPMARGGQPAYRCSRRLREQAGPRIAAVLERAYAASFGFDDAAADGIDVQRLAIPAERGFEAVARLVALALSFGRFVRSLRGTSRAVSDQVAYAAE